jgi:hypothetical protein
MNNNKPQFSHKLNRIEVAVWKNENENSIWHNITFQKSYRDGDGAMQTTTSLKMEDLPALSFLASKAYDYLASLEQ